LKNKIRSLWRYREFLPIEKDESVVSIGEGLTPMENLLRYAASIGLSDLALKLDYLNPTGSLKDRGTTVSVSKLRELREMAKQTIEELSKDARHHPPARPSRTNAENRSESDETGKRASASA
jgi:threonine synthase